MSIVVNWQSKNKQVIVARFEDPWTIDELLEARQKWYRMIRNVLYCVPIILDLSQTYDPPPGVLRQFIAMNRMPHPRQSWMVVFGLNPTYIKLSKHLFDGVVSPEKEIKIVNSLEDALRITGQVELG